MDYRPISLKIQPLSATNATVTREGYFGSNNSVHAMRLCKVCGQTVCAEPLGTAFVMSGLTAPLVCQTAVLDRVAR